MVTDILAEPQAAEDALPALSAADARLGCSRLMRHLRAVAMAGALKPIGLDLSRADDRACAAVVGGLAGMEHYLHLDGATLVFNPALTPAEASELLNFARSHKPPVLAG